MGLSHLWPRSVKDDAWSTVESDIDDKFNEKTRPWPIIRRMGVFKIAALFSLAMIILDLKFAYSRSGETVWANEFVVLTMIFVGADLALPMIAMLNHQGNRTYAAFRTSLVIFFTCLSCFVVIGSTTETATVTYAANDARIREASELKDKIERKTALRNAIAERRDGRSYEALAAAAKEFDEAAEREGRRGGCQSKCEALKKKALEARAASLDAKRFNELNKELAALTGDLTGFQGLRMSSDPLADVAAGFGLDRDMVAKYGLMWLGLLVAIATSVLWILCQHLSVPVLAQNRAYHARIADERRAAFGLPPKYTVDVEPEALLVHQGGPGPKQEKDGEGDVYNISIGEQKLLSTFENDDGVREANALFSTLFETSEGATLTAKAIYKAYQQQCLRYRPQAHYMTIAQLNQKLAIVAQYRDDVRVMADGRLLGWKLRETPVQAVPHLQAV